MRAVERFLREGAPVSGAARALPDPWCGLAMRAGLNFRWRRLRGRVRHNLTGFRGPLPARATERLVGDLAANMAAVVVFARRHANRPPSMAEVPGGAEALAAVESGLALGRGLIVVSAHLGCWPLALRVAGRVAPCWLLDAPMRSLAAAPDPFAPPSPHESLLRQRPDGDARALTALREQQIVAVLPDLPQRGRCGEPAWLMERQVRVSAAGAILARATRAPVLPLFCAVEEGSPRLWAGALLAGSPTLQQIVAAVEPAIRQRPEHWLGWLYRWAEAERHRRPVARALPRLRSSLSFT